MFLAALILLNVTAVILESVKSLEDAYLDIFNYFEAFSVAIFTLEYVGRIWACTVVEKYARPITGRIRFSLTPLLIIDFISIVPFYLPFIGVDLRVVRSLRLLRLIRILKLARYSSALRTIGAVFKSKKEELILSFVALMILLILSASLMYYAENNAQPDIFSSIPATVWWAVVTLTTVGYGDVYPITTAGKVIAGIISILGIGMVALPAGIISSGFVNQLNKQRIIHSNVKCPHCGKPIE